MELADPTAHRGLAYVAAMRRQGYVMTVEEFEAYIARPGLLPGKPGTPGTPDHVVRTTKLDRALVNIAAQALQPTLRTLTASVQTALDVRERHIEGTPGTPDAPAETVIEWLGRLRWLRVEDAQVRTTALGDAVLRHLEQASLEEEIPVSVLLDQGDELAEARVMAQIAELGPCAVVDRFFSFTSLLPIVYSTQVEQVLTGTGDQGKLTGLKVALRDLSIDRPFAIRKSDVFHDRFLIPHTGPVWLLGTSLTGLGRRLSVMVRMDDETMSNAIRLAFRNAWEDADPVVLEPLADPATAEETEQSEAAATSAAMDEADR